VRHGPEAFNYAFPQELDDKFLVISDQFPGVPWKYVDSTELISILHERIDEGFTFPLNPKWILCDPGWKGVYDKLLASHKPNVQDSMDIWYPPEVRDKIAKVVSEHPRGFEWEDSAAAKSSKYYTRTASEISTNTNQAIHELQTEWGESEKGNSGTKTDLAISEFRRYLVREKAFRDLSRIMNEIRLMIRLDSVGKSSHLRTNGLVTAMEMNRLAKQELSRTNRRESFALMKRANASILELEDDEEDNDEEGEGMKSGQINSREEGGAETIQRSDTNEKTPIDQRRKLSTGEPSWRHSFAGRRNNANQRKAGKSPRRHSLGVLSRIIKTVGKKKKRPQHGKDNTG